MTTPTPLKSPQMPIPFLLDDAQTLDAALCLLNENGNTPVLVGIDAEGNRFLAYGWAPGGDGWDIGICLDDPMSGEFSYKDIRECEECGAFERLPVSFLTFPVVCI